MSEYSLIPDTVKWQIEEMRKIALAQMALKPYEQMTPDELATVGSMVIEMYHLIMRYYPYAVFGPDGLPRPPAGV